MDELLKYTEDKKFVGWVLKPDKQLNSFWEEYEKNNPEEKEQIKLARVLILQFKSKKEDISEIETDNLFSGIMEGIEKQRNSQSIQKISISILKYAAVVLFFILLGIGFYYYKKPFDFELSAQKLVTQTSDNSGKSQLILFDGKKITLDERKSFIEYLNEKQIVINRKDTVFIKEINKTELNQLIVPHGKNSTIKFSDGTVVHINAGSRIVYPAVFNENKRQAYLVGEGFFEVSHNSDIPFVASTRNLEIEVLGTKFNLSAYPLEDVIETFLVEGRVKVKEIGVKLVKNEQILGPMQSAVFQKDNEEIEISNIGNIDYVSWYKGYLNFKSKNLATIVKKLERHFNIEIKLSNPKLEAKIISGKLKLEDEDVDTVVQVLANTASLSIEKLNESTYLLK